MTDDEVYTYRPSWSDYAGNACADALADRAALQMRVPESWGTRVEAMDRKTERVLIRLLVVNRFVLEQTGPRHFGATTPGREGPGAAAPARADGP